MSGRRKMLLAFDALERWSQARYLERKARAESGWTSVRVSKATARALRALAADVAAANPDQWRYQSPSLAELLEWLASGTALRPDAELARACKKAIAQMHAPESSSSSRRTA